MQWNSDDIEQYQEVSEYVDTLLIPLMPITIQTKNDRSKLAFQGELIQIISNEIERNYRGRIFLMPTFTYLSNKEIEVDQLNEWVLEAKTNPFKHIFFITFDTAWKKFESNLQGTLLWFPSISQGNLNDKVMQSLIKEQISQVTELIKTYW